MFGAGFLHEASTVARPSVRQQFGSGDALAVHGVVTDAVTVETAHATEILAAGGALAPIPSQLWRSHAAALPDDPASMKARTSSGR
jgi:hypothetical protein